jgi:hypothetical protein
MMDKTDDDILIELENIINESEKENVKQIKTDLSTIIQQRPNDKNTLKKSCSPKTIINNPDELKVINSRNTIEETQHNSVITKLREPAKKSCLSKKIKQSCESKMNVDINGVDIANYIISGYVKSNDIDPDKYKYIMMNYMIFDSDPKTNKIKIKFTNNTIYNDPIRLRLITLDMIGKLMNWRNENQQNKKPVTALWLVTECFSKKVLELLKNNPDSYIEFSDKLQNFKSQFISKLLS